MATACAPCIFGAVSTNILTFPTSISTIQVTIGTTLVPVGNITSLETFTSTLAPVPTTTVAGVVTSTLTPGEQPTWTFSGATLTYPTTYVDYISFQGAAVTAGTACGTNLAPTGLTIPAAIPTASLIYPLGQPAGLYAYLDSQPAFLGQLNNIPVESCAAPGGAAPSSAVQSSVTVTLTSTLPNTATITTTLPPPTTFTSTGSTTATITAVTPASAVSQTSLVTFSTISNPFITVSVSGQVSTITPFGASLPGTSGVSATASVLSSVLSALSSKASVASQSSLGVYTNSTSVGGTATASPPTVPASKVSSIVQYTGAAATQAAVMAGGYAAGLLGLAMYL